jgi:predicted Zn-dependent protease
MRISVGLLLFGALLVNAQDLPVSRGVNFYSLEKEASLGAQLAVDIQKTTTPLDSAAVRDYVDAIGARLTAQLPQQPAAKFTFTVIAAPAVTAPLEPLSLPGGYIFIPAGLILTAQNEAEFAGTLAHAIAHVAARHATRTASRAEIAQLAVTPLVSWGGWAGYAIRQASDTQVPIAFLQFQRGFESEADLLAVNIAGRAGYDPQGLATYIQRVQNDANPPALLAVPNRDARFQAIQAVIAGLPARTYTSSGDFARIQEEVRRLLPPVPAPAK